MEPEYEFQEESLERFLEASTVETEHTMARLRVGIGVLAIAISPYLVSMDLLELIFRPIPYLFFILGYLLYALGYYFWAPYRHFRLVAATRCSTFIDYAAVTVVLLNSGGLESPFWALWATVALTYVIRFRFGLREGIVTALLFLGTVELCNQVIPATELPVLTLLVGVGFSLLILIAGGLLMVRSERAAIRKALTAEYETIHRIVNTVQHSVNNPLAVISGNLQLLKRYQTGEKEKEWIDAAEEALTGIVVAVDKLRDLEDERLLVGYGPLKQYSVEAWYELTAGSRRSGGARVGEVRETPGSDDTETPHPPAGDK